MKRIIISIAGKLGIGKILRLVRTRRSRYCLRRNITKIKGTGPVRVAFLVYEPAMWDKQEPVYLEMQNRPEMEPYLIVVPDVGSSLEEAEVKRQFFLQKYQNVILYDEETAGRFQKKTFHYTFYQTPYAHKFPKDLQAHKLVKHTKICYIPYGYVGSADFFAVSSNEDFFSNAYFGFMDNEDMKAVLQEKFSWECKAGIQNFPFVGYPPFECYTQMGEPAAEIKNILWLPRWTYAEEGGGSHFLENKDRFNQLAAENPEANWIMRPHPLMFASLAELGLFPEEEADAYKKDMAHKGVILDEHSLLNETLRQTDLMIADYSSVIIMYFLTGRPIIYCDGGLPLTGSYSELRSAMYIANSWEEVVRYVQMLRSGEDPLKESRRKIAAEAGKAHLGATKRIVDMIFNDYRI